MCSLSPHEKINGFGRFLHYIEVTNGMGGCSRMSRTC